MQTRPNTPNNDESMSPSLQQKLDYDRVQRSLVRRYSDGSIINNTVGFFSSASKKEESPDAYSNTTVAEFDYYKSTNHLG